MFPYKYLQKNASEPPQPSELRRKPEDKQLMKHMKNMEFHRPIIKILQSTLTWVI